MREKLQEIKKAVNFRHMAIKAGIEPTLLTREVTGRQKLSPLHYDKVREVFHDLGRKLLEI